MIEKDITQDSLGYISKLQEQMELKPKIQ